MAEYMDKIQQLIRFGERKLKEAEESNTDDAVYCAKRYWQGYIKGLQAAVKMIRSVEDG